MVSSPDLQVEEEDDYDNSHCVEVHIEDDGSVLSDAASSTQEDGDDEDASTEMEESEGEETNTREEVAGEDEYEVRVPAESI